MTVDRDKLIKLLMLSTSDCDPEALSAIRMANNLLKKSNTSWERIFAITTKPAPIIDDDMTDRYATGMEVVEEARRILNQMDVTFEEKNKGYHFVIKHKGVRIDYWPTSSKILMLNKWYKWNIVTLAMKLNSM